MGSVSPGLAPFIDGNKGIYAVAEDIERDGVSIMSSSSLAHQINNKLLTP
jgi:hypothetical protein